MDVPCANPIVPTMQEAVEVPQVRFHDRVADDPVGTQVPDWEELQRLRAEGLVTIHDTNKLLNDCDELIPKWLNVVKGLVNSEDFPLNIYQETLLQNKILRVVRRNYVTKYLEMLAEIAELKDDYEKFYEQYGKCRNDEDSTVGVKTAELLTFNTSKPGGKRISFKEYVYRMTQEQNDVYYITGENIAVVSSSPFEENLRKKDREELHVADPMDEYAVHQFKESDGKKLKSPTKQGLNLGDEDEEQMLEELKAKLEPSTKLMKDVLGDKVEMVIASDRIVDSPCVLTTSEYGWSAKMKRIMEAQALRDNSMTSHMVSKKTIEVNPTHSIMMELMKKASAWQQQHKSSKHQLTKQATRQERGGERKKEGNREGKRGRSEQEEGRDQEERKEEERKVEERGSEQVEKDAMDWTVVTRSKQKQRRVQIFVKVNGSKASPMEVSLTDDRVEDVMRRIQNDEDAYVTMHGRVLKKGERLKSCGVTDGCTVQVTSRLRGGGKHKDKKGQKERKRAAKPQGPEQKAVQGCDRDAAIRMIEENEESRKMMVRMLEENEDNQKMIESMSEGSDVDMEQTLQNYRTACRDVLGWDREQVGMMERGLRWAVEARRKERREEQEQRREEEQEQRREEEQEEQRREEQEQRREEEQEQRREEEQEEQRREEQEQRRQEEQEETRAESTDEPEVTSRPVEVRTGRGSAGLVRGGDGRHLADESNRTGKGKGNGGKGEHGGKGGVQVEEEEYRWDAKRKVVRMMKKEEDQEADEEDEQGRVAPNMGAGGSHPQATSDPREARALSWADCKDEEETTEERPPGLEEEEMENEPKTQQEEKLTQVESEQEAQEEETRAQEARELKRAQEAREEERKAQEAREEQRRAQEAREEQRAQEAREEQKRAQEAREEQKRAQEAREEQRAQEAREEQRAQEAREEQRAQEAREEQKSAGSARGTKEGAGSARRKEGSGRAKRARQRSCDPGRARGRSKGPRRTRRRSEFTARR